MSRSFERKVEKNRQKYNLNQQKKGVKPGNTLGSKGEGVVFRGRNVLLPLLFIVLGAMYAAMGFIGGTENINTLYVITVALYFLLGIVIYLRRPYLRIYKNKLFTSKFNRDRSLDAGSISKIKWSGKTITIVTKTKEPNWTFSGSRNFYNMDELGSALQEYAAAHGVELERK
ncbi:hypothetical protein AWM70_08630 [Paenibacillus yonginensis]|uniref:Methyltransferase n=1 Tax=Paenibacillus yonginensis TaxID=1462996 RepID=A0A1B1MZN8_9BACL|nr:hypothetical protein [Paenibacillus yonginensis]ANS74643.1 hypothetical protein AWM70_08630 [Paenibacillus yonginensis]